MKELSFEKMEEKVGGSYYAEAGTNECNCGIQAAFNLILGGWIGAGFTYFACDQRLLAFQNC